MRNHPWLTAVLAILLLVAAGLAYGAGIPWLPSGLTFFATLFVLGLTMHIEDRLLKRYDTPHEDDTHPPALVLFRFARGTVLVLLGILIFWLAF